MIEASAHSPLVATRFKYSGKVSFLPDEYRHIWATVKLLSMMMSAAWARNHSAADVRKNPTNARGSLS